MEIKTQKERHRKKYRDTEIDKREKKRREKKGSIKIHTLKERKRPLNAS